MSLLDKLNPYAAVAKVVGIGIVIIAIVSLAFSWMARGQEIASLKAWQQSVVISTTDASVTPDAKGVRKSLSVEQVPAAIAALKRSLDSCQGAAREVNDATVAAKARADAADQALANAQLLMRGEYSSAAKRIEALANQRAAATPELSCQATATDSKAAWEAWK